MAASPQMIGPYRVLGLLGRGGMGAVYRALGPEGDEVALKVLIGVRGANPQQLQRFDRELRALAQVAHPAVVRLRNSGHYRGAPYVVLDLHEGGTLQDRLTTGGPITPGEAVSFGLQLAEGLTAVHGQHLLHRDLKPDNVLIDAEGRAALTDFGLVKDLDRVGETQQLSRTGAAYGTPGYWSPEQASGTREVGPPTDIYGLGATLYAALTGEAPISGASLLEYQLATLRQIPLTIRSYRDDVSPELDQLVLRCLEKEPEARWASAAELAGALRELHQGGAAVRRGGRRGWLKGLGAAASVAALIGLAGIGAWSLPLSPQEKLGRAKELLEVGAREPGLVLLREAAEEGERGAMTRLAELLDDEGSPSEAEAWYRRAAGLGDTEAMVKLGSILLREPAGEAEAARWYLAASEAGSSDGTYHLGYLYRRSAGGLEDMSRAQSLLERAAGQGHTDAMIDLGVMALRGELKSGVDKAEAVRWFSAAAEAGSPHGAYALGNSFWSGEGVPRDLSRAQGLYQTAAEQGHTDAMIALADLALSGDMKSGVDKKGAARWVLAAAEAGSPRGTYRLGYSYWRGEGVPKDLARAQSLLETAAGQGDPDAMVALGVLAASGEGSSGRDGVEAERWFQLAAESGNADAMFNLGLLLQTDHGEGRGDEAIEWYRRAAAAGHPEAANLIPPSEGD